MLRTAHLPRLLALEAWKKDIRELQVKDTRWMEDWEMEWSRSEHFKIIDELLEDVRGTMKGEASQLRVMWANKKSACRQTRRY